MTTQENAANSFEYWREMFQKSTEAWAQAAGSTGKRILGPFFQPGSGRNGAWLRHDGQPQPFRSVHAAVYQ